MGKEKFDWREIAGNKDLKPIVLDSKDIKSDIAPKLAKAEKPKDSFDLNVMNAVFDGPTKPHDNMISREDRPS